MCWGGGGVLRWCSFAFWGLWFSCTCRRLDPTAGHVSFAGAMRSSTVAWRSPVCWCGRSWDKVVRVRFVLHSVHTFGPEIVSGRGATRRHDSKVTGSECRAVGVPRVLSVRLVSPVGGATLVAVRRLLAMSVLLQDDVVVSVVSSRHGATLIM